MEETSQAAPSNFMYLKNGPKATNYVSPGNLFAIAGNQVVKIDRNLILASAGTKAALASRHIVEVDESEYTAFKEEEAKSLGTTATGISHFEALGEAHKMIPGAGDPAQASTLAPSADGKPVTTLSNDPNVGIGRSGVPLGGEAATLNKEAGDTQDGSPIVNKQTEIPATGDAGSSVKTIPPADDDDDLTQSEMIDALKSNPKVSAEDKKGLAKMSIADVKAIYTKYTTKS